MLLFADLSDSRFRLGWFGSVLLIFTSYKWAFFSGWAAQDLLAIGASMPKTMQLGGWGKSDTVMRYLEQYQSIELGGDYYLAVPNMSKTVGVV
jgi:hypothetical protein